MAFALLFGAVLVLIRTSQPEGEQIGLLFLGMMSGVGSGREQMIVRRDIPAAR